MYFLKRHSAFNQITKSHSKCTDIKDPTTSSHFPAYSPTHIPINTHALLPLLAHFGPSRSITVKEEASFVSQWFFDLQMQILLPHSKPVSSIIMPCLCYMCKNCDPGTLSSVFKHERVINTFKNLLIKKNTHTLFCPYNPVCTYKFTFSFSM